MTDPIRWRLAGGSALLTLSSSALRVAVGALPTQRIQRRLRQDVRRDGQAARRRRALGRPRASYKITRLGPNLDTFVPARATRALGRPDGDVARQTRAPDSAAGAGDA
jgi:hypothetical protein